MNPTYDTDKYASGLADYYEKYLKPFKNKKLKLLEIGIKSGGSLHMFKELLPNADIFGIDIEVPANAPESAIIRLINQNDTAALIDFNNRFGPFDIVIDDGCHMAAEILNCFNVFFSKDNIDILYFIEDWSVCYYIPYRIDPRYKDIRTFAHQLLTDVDDTIQTLELIHNRPPCFSIITIKKCKI